MPTWDELIDDYERSVVGIERWLAADDRSRPPGGWEPPSQPPTELPSARQLQRLQRVHDRDLALRSRLEDELGHTAKAIATDMKRSRAARAYAARYR